MPRNRILAHRQSFQEHRYPSDLFIEEHYGPHEDPALSSERIQQSTKKPKTKKRNLIARLALHRRSSKRKTIPEQLIAGAEYNKTDYRERWPTVTTLVTQSDPRYLEDIDEEFEEEGHARRRSVKAKALEAVATPLDWLTDRLGSVSEHLGRQIKVADGRGQGKPVSTSTQRSTAKPGRSTHPYDTGVVTSAEAIPKECPTAPAQTQITEDTGMTKRDDLLRAKESLIIPTKQRLRRLSERSATSERAHQKRLLEHGQAIANSANQRSATQGRHYLQLSSEAVEGPMLLEERKKW
ncbi:hypothetical protein PFICI_14268 [Pestalotiopsis fici W106-1]|uniref:Uncharacterized protein n=1 Tax=Pestalotiopsis fici (strain W106-1 / CGMCC3.15140) TaxID=1229662 RepID=W3WMM1_PESFW|nr:uncharacterized protein PFICI_14268 [Pestalotiopsis fici W106-1]ETS74402.1 hypothetical protein PFICI_14268 [Pestalotiopsis fici W106-1]